MTEDVLFAKIETMRRCLVRIRKRLPASAEELAKDIDAQDIIAVNLERMIQAAVDIASHKIADLEILPAQTMGESFAILAKRGIIPDVIADKLRKAVGFRNISVHNYQAISWDIVFNICTRELTVFEELITVNFKFN